MSDLESVLKITNVLCIAVISLFVTEHACRLYNIKNRPSVILSLIGDNLKAIFKYLGEKIAIMSSYLTLINFGEFKITFIDLFKSIINIMTSGKAFIEGYCQQAKKYVDGPWMIYFGSFFIIVVMCYFIYKYKLFTRFNNFQQLIKLKKSLNKLISSSLEK